MKILENKNPRYYRIHLVALDGYRGIAASIVAGLHICQQNGISTIINNAELAVDFFFILSGFVIAMSYERRLASGSMGFFEFARLRLIRLYPVIFIAALLGIAWRIFEERFSFGAVATSALFALILLPLPRVSAPNSTSYPINGPSWSLTYEILINFIFASAAKWLRGRFLVLAIFISAAAEIVLGITSARLNYAVVWSDQPVAFLRATTPFLIGVLFYHRLHKKVGAPNGLWPIFGALALVALLAAPIANVYYSLLSIFVLFPILILAGSFQPLSGIVRSSFLLMREISYPLYAINEPVARWLSTVTKQYFENMPKIALLFSVISEIIVISFLALLISRFYDTPMRSWLKKFTHQAGIQG